MYSQRILKTQKNGHSDSDSDSDSDYKSLIPKCNEKFCVGNKKKNWKKIFSKKIVLDSYNIFVKNVNNIFIIGFTPPDSDNFIPLNFQAYGNGEFINNTSIVNYVVVQPTCYIPFSAPLTNSLLNMTVITSPYSNTTGNLFKVQFAGTYIFTLGICIQDLVNSNFSIFVNNKPLSTIYDFHTDVSQFFGGTCIVSLIANDVIGVVNNYTNTPTSAITLTTNGTTFSLVYLSP